MTRAVGGRVIGSVFQPQTRFLLTANVAALPDAVNSGDVKVAQENASLSCAELSICPKPVSPTQPPAAIAAITKQAHERQGRKRLHSHSNTGDHGTRALNIRFPSCNPPAHRASEAHCRDFIGQVFRPSSV